MLLTALTQYEVLIWWRITGYTIEKIQKWPTIKLTLKTFEYPFYDSNEYAKSSQVMKVITNLTSNYDQIHRYDDSSFSVIYLRNYLPQSK